MVSYKHGSRLAWTATMVSHNIRIQFIARCSSPLDRVSLTCYGTGVAGLMLTLATPYYGSADRPSSLTNSSLISTTINVSRHDRTCLHCVSDNRWTAFLTTYLCTATFSLYLVPYAVRHVSKRWLWPALNPDGQIKPDLGNDRCAAAACKYPRPVSDGYHTGDF